jgi:hypothetical protein
MERHRCRKISLHWGILRDLASNLERKNAARGIAAWLSFRAFSGCAYFIVNAKRYSGGRLADSALAANFRR